MRPSAAMTLGLLLATAACVGVPGDLAPAGPGRAPDPTLAPSQALGAQDVRSVPEEPMIVPADATPSRPRAASMDRLTGSLTPPAPDPAPDPDAETGIGAQAEFAGSEVCDRPDWCRHVVAGAFEECAC